MSLSLIKTALHNYSMANQMSLDAWLADVELRGEKVAMYRDYADGNHYGDLTKEMRDLLRIGRRVADDTRPGSRTAQFNIDHESTSPFNLNRMDNIIQTVVDRLEIKRIEDTGEDANDWINDVLKVNRFDALQLEVHEAAVRDADSYVLVDYCEKTDREPGHVRFTVEPAYDGTSGMIPLYQKRGQSEMVAAVKIWHVTSETGNIADTMRVNVYYKDKIEKFISTTGSTQLTPFVEDGTNAQGTVKWLPGIVPVVHFKNRAKAYDSFGRSEIDDAIPPQDAINRLMYSMVASAELAGIPVRVAKGFDPPAGLTPGAWVTIGASGLSKDDVADATTMEQGQITPFLDGMNFLIGQVDQLTRTPNAENMGTDASSGEALKQREIGLLGKVKRLHIAFGNAWEDVLKIAHAVDTAYGVEKPPEYEYFSTQWRSPEIRNVKEIVETALSLQALIGDEMTIRLIANEYDWSEDEIQDILTKKREQQTQQNLSMINALYDTQTGRANRNQPASTGASPVNGNNPMMANLNSQ